MIRYIAALLAVLAGPVAAQAPQCAPHDRVIALLSGKYGEDRRSAGLAGAEGQAIMEIHANEETGTWTIIIIRPDGIACLVISGSHFHDVEPMPKGEAG